MQGKSIKKKSEKAHKCTVSEDIETAK